MSRGLIIAAFCSAAFVALAAGVNIDYMTPPSTFSPDRRYGVMIPVFHIESDDPDDRTNNVVKLRTGDLVAVLHADPPGSTRI